MPYTRRLRREKYIIQRCCLLISPKCVDTLHVIRPSINMLKIDGFLSTALAGNLTMCPPYVRQAAKAHCHLLTQHGHSCYELNRGHTSWSRANQHCTERGGHLVTINSAQEDSYLYNILTNTNHSNRVWIGLQDRDKEGNFHWVTGNNLLFHSNK